MPTGHVERIRFTEGVQQVEGASLKSPYDLTNAEVDQYGFLQSLNAAGSYPDTTGLSRSPTKPLARSPLDASWVSGSDALAFQHGILYAADESGSPRVKVYQDESDDQAGLPPRISSISVDTGDAGGEALTRGLYATYLFIPINSRGEAGPWQAKTVGDYSTDVDVQFSLIISSNTEWLEAYRTPEFDMIVRENDPSPSLFYYVNRFSTIEEVPGGADSGSYAVKYDNIPYSDRAPKTGINYFGVSKSIKDKDFTTETHYVSFPRILKDTSGLSPNTQYQITGTNTIGDTTYLVLGNAPTFDSDDLMQWEKGDDNHRTPERYAWHTEGVDAIISKDDGSGGTVKVDTIEVTDNGPKMRIDGAVSVGPRGPSTSSGRDRGGRGSSSGRRNARDRNRSNRPRGSTVGRSSGPTDRRSSSDSSSRQSDEQVDYTPTSASLSRNRNVHAQVGPNYRGFTARTMFYSGGVMYYGAPKWPTKEPMVTRSETDSTNGYDVRLQLRYRTKDGERYGPFIEILNCSLASVTYQGELGINVYVNDGGWKLYKRQTPNDYGGYGPRIFSIEDYNGDYIEAKNVDTENTYLRENNVVLMSATNRPWEATFTRHFTVAGDETVRALFKARLKENDMRAYNFYVATDEAIYVANPVPENDSVFIDPVDPNIGIKEKHLWTSVPGGAVFYGTDNRLHYMTGRKLQFLETEDAIPFTDVRDLAYDIQENELAVATNNGIWFYDFDRKGWMKNYDTNTDTIFWDRESEMLVFDDNGSWKQIDNSGAEMTAEVITQWISNVTEETSIEKIEVDYEKTGYQEDDATTWGSVQHAIRHPSVLRADEDPGANPGKINFTVDAPSNRPRFLKMDGRGHQFRIEGFTQLRETKLHLSAHGDGNNS